MAVGPEAGATTISRTWVAVAGNPNSGKTTLFNALTGMRQKVGNYPGVTVEKREGTLAGTGVTLLDLPGAYGLSARSPDEQIARDVLLGRVDGTPPPGGVLLVIDASSLERNLYLVSQVLDLGIPAVIACNMMDVADVHGRRVDCAALSSELGVPVVPTVASRGKGVEALRRILEHIDDARPNSVPLNLPPAIEEAVTKAAAAMGRHGGGTADVSRGSALLWLLDHASGEVAGRQSAEAYLARVTPQLADTLREVAEQLDASHPDAAAEVIEARYSWIGHVANRSVCAEANPESPQDHDSETLTDRIDHVLTHRVFGLGIFAGLMFVLFLSVFSWAEPLMDLIEAGQAALAGWVGSILPEGILRSLLADGVIAGVGAVVAFFPQICILFFCMAILEDSGYMARAAFLMDRVMSRVGLHGKSFIPLLSSYACAIPGIMATRTIENKRDRFTTIMVAPLMSCSARLPVYLVLVGAVFGDRTYLKAGTMFGLYVFGTATALIMALVFKRTVLAGPRPAFIMELPPYHMPRPGMILRTVWERGSLFLTKAGTIICAASIVIWALSYLPRLPESESAQEIRRELGDTDARTHGAGVVAGDEAVLRENVLAGARLRYSSIGRLGRAIEPIIKPLGYDWRIGTALVSSFLAREVFVSTMGITFAVGEADEGPKTLRTKLAAATWPDGRRVLTPLVGVGLMVFYVLACQCVSTLAVVRRETNSWRWPAFMFAYMTILAYSASFLVYQIGSRLGLGTS